MFGLLDIDLTIVRDFVSFVFWISLLRYLYFLVQAGHFWRLLCWWFVVFYGVFFWHVVSLPFWCSLLLDLGIFIYSQIFCCVSKFLLIHTKLNIGFQMRLQDVDNTEWFFGVSCKLCSCSCLHGEFRRKTAHNEFISFCDDNTDLALLFFIKTFHQDLHILWISQCLASWG